jgi:hypothetical protein
MVDYKPNIFNLTYPPFPFNRTGMPVIDEMDDVWALT